MGVQGYAFDLFLNTRTIQYKLNSIELAIVLIAMENASELDDFGLFINRVHDPVLALGHAEAREAFVREVG